MSVFVSGGTSPYNYTWSNGGSGASQFDLAAGQYTAAIVDANGCSTAYQNAVNQPDVLSTQINGNDAGCAGGSNGSLSAVVSGGTAPYSYQWSNGSTNSSISGLSAGTYQLTVTDANGCQISVPELLHNQQLCRFRPWCNMRHATAL
ncbi:MAG: SprB repeat-containing protein [Bacteroidia bacterium]